MDTNEPRTIVTRRTLLRTAAVATATVPLLAHGAPASAVPLVRVTPVWSERLRRSYGVGFLPAANLSAYANIDQWMQRIAATGAGYVRGRYKPGTADTARIVQRCRALGLKWLMSVIPENWSMSEAELRAALVHIRNNAADLCIGIEGINEPNHNRDGSPLRPDWPRLTVGYQRVIKTFLDGTPSMAAAVSVGPSLQMGADDPSPDFFALRDAGLAPYLDYAGLHNYPKGWAPQNLVDQRLGWVRDAWGNVPTWVTETGYNTALGTPLVPDGPGPVPEDVAATYGPRSVLEYWQRGCRAARFQLLDRPNPANDVVLYNFGIFENTGNTPSTWSPKAEFTTMQGFLTSLRDTATAYSPPPVNVGVQGPQNLKWLAVGKSGGSQTLLLYRSAPVWNPNDRTRRTVPAANVTVSDRLGTRVVKVGGQVVSLPIR